MDQLGRYEIQEMIGEGAMSQVYKAYDPKLQRTLAIKVLKPEYVEDKERLQFFLNEVHVTGKLNHQNIVQIFDVGDVDAVPFIVMEYVEWGIDAIYSGTQKCLSAPPGISPVSFGPKAIEKVKARKTPVPSWFLDKNLVMGYWGGEGKRAYHHTAPVNALYALHESLVILHEEGLEASWARHQHHHAALKAGLEKMGLSFLVDESCRLPQLNSVSIPEGADDAAVRTALLNEYNLEIGAGLGALAGKVWRIGLMGSSANRRNVTLCLAALEATLSAQGAKINQGVALKAAESVYSQA
jgi:alanine-glyoxylate transaminase/serine-glyoxylate transaminase/serine-pyruvate transaminase